MSGLRGLAHAPIQDVFGSPITRSERRERFGDHVRNPKRGDWSREEDDRLMALVEQDLPFRQIAARLGGRTRNACLGRIFRLRKKLGGQGA